MRGKQGDRFLPLKHLNCFIGSEWLMSYIAVMTCLYRRKTCTKSFIKKWNAGSQDHQESKPVLLTWAACALTSSKTPALAISCIKRVVLKASNRTPGSHSICAVTFLDNLTLYALGVYDCSHPPLHQTHPQTNITTVMLGIYTLLNVMLRQCILVTSSTGFSSAFVANSGAGWSLRTGLMFY